jgi:hypothetical protein
MTNVVFHERLEPRSGYWQVAEVHEHLVVLRRGYHAHPAFSMQWRILRHRGK